MPRRSLVFTEAEHMHRESGVQGLQTNLQIRKLTRSESRYSLATMADWGSAAGGDQVAVPRTHGWRETKRRPKIGDVGQESARGEREREK